MVRFWNKFSVEVDKSTISEISKFSYLLDLTKGKPRNDIFGLPHTTAGYAEAERNLAETYGKNFKVHRALVKELENVHTITNIHKVASIQEFYNKLARIIRTLATMKKLDSVQSMVYTLMDKLGPVQRILAQNDDNWEEWKLEDLVENLRKYVKRCPLQTFDNKGWKVNQQFQQRKDKLLMERGYQKDKSCVYCGSIEHRTNDCTKVLTLADHGEHLKSNKLCFNCTGKKQGFNTTVSTGVTLHAMVKGVVKGQEIQIMIDTGASSSYVCSSLITKLDLTPAHKENRCIEQMFGSITKVVEIYQIKIESTVTN